MLWKQCICSLLLTLCCVGVAYGQCGAGRWATACSRTPDQWWSEACRLLQLHSPPPSLHHSPHISLFLCVSILPQIFTSSTITTKDASSWLHTQLLDTLLTNYVCKWQNNHNKTSKPRHLCLIINSNCDRSISNEFSSRHLKCDHPHVSRHVPPSRAPTCPTPQWRGRLCPPPSTGRLPYIQPRPRWHTINLNPVGITFCHRIKIFATPLQPRGPVFSAIVQLLLQIEN